MLILLILLNWLRRYGLFKAAPYFFWQGRGRGEKKKKKKNERKGKGGSRAKSWERHTFLRGQLKRQGEGSKRKKKKKKNNLAQ